MAKPRHKRKQSLLERNGERVRVSRLTPSGDVREYRATLRCEIDAQGELGRVFLERMKLIYSFARMGDFTLFKAAIDLPLKGCRDWWMISGAPVEMSRHTQRVSYTKLTMDMLAAS
jgi:hypothetical protein